MIELGLGVSGGLCACIKSRRGMARSRKRQVKTKNENARALTHQWEAVAVGPTGRALPNLELARILLHQHRPTPEQAKLSLPIGSLYSCYACLTSSTRTSYWNARIHIAFTDPGGINHGRQYSSDVFQTVRVTRTSSFFRKGTAVKHRVTLRLCSITRTISQYRPVPATHSISYY